MKEGKETLKIKFSLGKKIFLFVLAIITLLIVIVYTSTIESVSRGFEQEMKIRGISISKSISSSLSAILSSIIADRIAKDPKSAEKVFKSKEFMSEIFSELQLREEYLNLIETFGDIPKTEDIIWASAVDMSKKVLVHSRKDIPFMADFSFPKGTVDNEQLLKAYLTLVSNLNVRNKNILENFEESILSLFGGRITTLEYKIPKKELINLIKNNLGTDEKETLKVIEKAEANLIDNIYTTKEKYSLLYWNIKNIQRKYNDTSFGNEFRNKINSLLSVMGYNYLTYEIVSPKLNETKEFIDSIKEKISKEDFELINVMIEQFIKSSFGITGFIQYYTESMKGKEVKRILFSYPILIKEDINKYIGDLYIGMSTESIERAITSIERQIQTGALLSVLIGILFTILLSVRISRGARIITKAMDELSKGNLQVKADFKSEDEIGFIAQNFNRMVNEIAEKEKMRDIMNKVVSEEIAKELMEKGMELGGELRFTTMLFSDIRGFTSMSEKMDPRTLISILNEYMTEMVEIVKKYKGVVDKFVGDEIMVVYGAPISFSEKGDAFLAVITAYDMIKRVEELHKIWQEQGKPLLTPGIGINSGHVVAGNMGSKDRLSYTVIGDAVNTAARLCGAAPGKHCIISENTHKLVNDLIEVEEQEPIRVKGKSEPLKIYSVTGIKPEGYEYLKTLLGSKN